MTERYDFIVVGGGIAGAAVGAELVGHGRVVLLEMEDGLAYHTTGRSAAISMESYGNALIRSLTCRSRSYFESPPEGRAAGPLCGPRGALIISDVRCQEKLSARYRVISQHVPHAMLLDARQLSEMVDFLAPGRWVGGVYEESALDLDVHAIHSSYIGAMRRGGGAISTSAGVVAAHKNGTSWELKLSDGTSIAGAVVVNAAGAWADRVAVLCGIHPVGVRPLRRTVVTVDPGRDVSRVPYLGTVDEQIFLKPDAQRLIVSPCDETDDEPRDAFPEDIDVAITMARLEAATTLRPRSVVSSWAGLRVFVPDRSPVIGPDPLDATFFWCAAFGGYGIQISPAMARLCVGLIVDRKLPADMSDLDSADFAPDRLHRSANVPARVLPVADLR